MSVSYYDTMYGKGPESDRTDWESENRVTDLS